MSDRMSNQRVMVITGTRKSIGRYLVEYYIKKGFQVIGCSRQPIDYELDNYRHFCLDVVDEPKVKQMFAEINKTYGHLDILVNNAGIHMINYSLLTTVKSAQDILNTNVIGVFYFAVKLSN